MSSSRRLLHYYLADQDWEQTTSRGIYHFSQKWLGALASRAWPGWRVIVSIDPSERTRMLPAYLPEWIQVREVRGLRLWKDQVWAPWFNRRMKVDVAFYPKGWVPFLKVGSEKRVAMVHDCIIEHYQQTHPGFIPLLKLRYLLTAKVHTLNCADLIFTNSEFSRSEIDRVYQLRKPITVLPLGESFDSTTAPALPGDQRRGVLIFASRFPHKRTEETLRMLLEWKRKTGNEDPLEVVGKSQDMPRTGEEVRMHDNLCDSELARLIGRVRAVVMLNDIEGFGMPILEAYARRTPVVYRNAHAFAEILDGCKGKWEGEGPDDFCDAIRDAMEMTGEEIDKIAGRLRKKYNWERSTRIGRQLIERLVEEKLH